MEKEKLKIVIADDHPLLLKGIKYALSKYEEFEVVGEASDGEEALKLITDLHPDFAVLDYEMPKLNGLDIAEKVLEQNLAVNIIFLTFYTDAGILKEAFARGVRGYISKESLENELVKAIDIINGGGKYLSQNLAFALLSPTPRKDWDDLTKSEKKVIKHVAENKTTQEIADLLFISTRTVERHRSNICKKLKITGNNALVRYVLEHKEEILKEL